MRTEDPLFWTKVTVGKPEECWPWNGHIFISGYGSVKRARKTWSAHRYAYTVAFGPIPAGLLVRHKCDNRRCCNPNHLETGTHSDNARDAVARGRWRTRSGETNHSSKVTDAQRREIIAIGHTETLEAIAKRFGLQHTSVLEIQQKGGVGRRPPTKGETHHHAKLTWEKVEYIRQSRKQNFQLAAELGVDSGTVSNVRLGKSWKC